MLGTIIAGVAGPARAAHEEAGQRGWTPADSLSVRYLARNVREPTAWFMPSDTPPELFAGRPDLIAKMLGEGPPPDAYLPSPDGRHFLVITASSDAQADRNVDRMLVFDTVQVRKALDHGGAPPSPAAFAEFHARGILSGIWHPAWEADGKGIVFQAITTLEDGWEGFRLDVASGKVVQLTHFPDPHDLVELIRVRARRALYRVKRNESIPQFRYPLEPIQPNPMPRGPGVLGGVIQSSALGIQLLPKQYYAALGAGAPVVVAPFSDAAISPDGSMAMVFQSNHFALWRFGADGAPATVGTVPAPYLEIAGGRMFWTADGRRVVLVGATLADRKEPGIAVYDVSTGSLTPFTGAMPAKLNQVAWFEGKSRLVLRRKDEPVPLVYRLEGDGWKREDASLADPLHGLRIENRQDYNTPPMLIAAEGKRELELLPPDPALEHLRIAKGQVFSYRDYDGVTREGLLFLPPDHVPGKPLPLVIQHYAQARAAFLPDGHTKTAYALQALAARGMAVAVIDSADLSKFVINKTVTDVPVSPDTEAPLFGKRLDAVIDALAEQGLIRPDKIGVIGFSRMGYYVHYAISHPGRTRLASAVVAQSVTQAYPSYLVEVSSGESVIGDQFVGHSFWQDPDYSFKHDVLFNVDRVVTPVQFQNTRIDKGGGLADTPARSMEVIGAYQANDKPIDEVMVAQGDHNLKRPQERVESMAAHVDWQAFWLLDEEDPDPAKAAQYVRWRKLRDDWKAELAKGPTHGEDGFIALRSGLRYAIRTRKVGASPEPGATVKFRYVARRSDGSTYADIRKAGTPASMTLREVDPAVERLPGLGRGMPRPGDGWMQGLALMHPGETATFIMPARLAGDLAPQGAPPDEQLRFEVEMMPAQG